MTARVEARHWPASRAAARDRVIALVEARVRFRFALGPQAFADRLLRDVEQDAPDAAKPSVDRVSRLCLDDLYLASACALGDDEAWRECSTAHFGFIREFAARFLPDADSRDLADQVIADLWQRGKMARYEGRSSLRTWLGAVVAHAALNVRQSRRYDADERSPHAAFGDAVRPDPHDEESARLLAALVGDAVAGLPPDDRLLLLLSYEQALSLDAIAPLLGTSKPTLSRRLKRLRLRLRAVIDRMAHDRFGTRADLLRTGVDLSRLELDLARLLRDAAAVKANRPESV